MSHSKKSAIRNSSLLKDIFNCREKIVINGLKYILGTGITLLYAAVWVTALDISFNYIMGLELDVGFQWKTLFFMSGAGLIALSTIIFLWLLIIHRFVKAFNYVSVYLDFIDTSKKLKKSTNQYDADPSVNQMATETLKDLENENI